MRAKRLAICALLLCLMFTLIGCNSKITVAIVPIYGTSVMEEKPYFTCESIMDISEENGTPQDIDIFGDYLFVTVASPDKIKIYSLKSKKLIYEKKIWIAHGSGAQFSSEYYDVNDQFPLFYVGGLNDSSIQVLRITKNKDNWDITSVKRIRIKTGNGYHFSPALDNENKTLYSLGTVHQKNDVASDCVIVKCSSNTTKIRDNAYEPDIVKKTVVEYPGTYQGHKFYNGHLISVFSKKKTNGNYWGYIAEIDVDTGVVMEKVDITSITMKEGEGLTYRVDENGTTWYYSDTSTLFELKFYYNFLA